MDVKDLKPDYDGNIYEIDSGCVKKIVNVKPELIWHYFDEITKVPRPSKKEGKIRAFLLDFAREHHLDAKEDVTGNIVISKAATQGFESSPGVILQSHMDMVCEKNSDVIHDFENDPKHISTESGYVPEVRL